MQRRDVINLAVVLFVGVLIGVATQRPDPPPAPQVVRVVTDPAVKDLARELAALRAAGVPPRAAPAVRQAQRVLHEVHTGQVTVVPATTTTTRVVITTPPVVTTTTRTTTTTARPGSRHNPADFHGHPDATAPTTTVNP